MLILDLSSPDGQSVNDGIPKTLFSVRTSQLTLSFMASRPKANWHPNGEV